MALVSEYLAGASTRYQGSSDLLLFAIVAAVLLFLRRRAGAVLLTILTFNPIIWIINYQYFKKRWPELASTSAGKSA
ncbi:MAG: hypothetical protein JXA15_12045 [Spirochaetales bacterium]|nr:hypothetical protein [Spirochaetales bacterium]